MTKIHHTRGVYANGDHKDNGVHPDHLEDHIKYNKTMRYGRALLVDCVCVYPGYLNEAQIKEAEEKCRADNKTYTNSTEPYK